MRFPAILLALMIVAAAPAAVRSQTEAITDGVAAKRDAELRRDVASMLRETMTEVGGLRSRGNRIAAGTEIATLMAAIDESEAATMFGALIDDFKAELAEADAAFAAYVAARPEAARAGGGLGDGPPSGRDPSTPYGKFMAAMKIRAQLADRLGAVDPAWPRVFIDDTRAMLTDAAERARRRRADPMLLVETWNKYARRKPKQTSIEAQKVIPDSPVTGLNLMLAKRLYAADSDAGADYAAALSRRMLALGIDDGNEDVFDVLLSYAARSREIARDGSRRALLPEADMRALADTLAKHYLKKDASEDGRINQAEDLAILDLYAPAQAAALRRKYKFPPAETSAPARFAARPLPSPSPSPRPPEEKTTDRQPKASPTAEQRAEFMAKLEKEIAGIETPAKKAKALIDIASQMEQAGSVEIAGDALALARRILPDSPRRASDCELVWQIALAYAGIEPARSFEMTGEMIPWLDNVSDAIVTFGSFADEDERDISDSEFKFNDLEYGLLRGLRKSQTRNAGSIKRLALADFGRTRALAESFGRAEIRIAAKLVLAQAALGMKDAPPQSDEQDQLSMPAAVVMKTEKK